MVLMMGLVPTFPLGVQNKNHLPIIRFPHMNAMRHLEPREVRVLERRADTAPENEKTG